MNSGWFYFSLVLIYWVSSTSFATLPHFVCVCLFPSAIHATPAVTRQKTEEAAHTDYFFLAFRSSILHNHPKIHSTFTTEFSQAFFQLIAWPYFSSYFFCSPALPFPLLSSSSSSLSSGGITTTIHYTSTHPLLIY